MTAAARRPLPTVLAGGLALGLSLTLTGCAEGARDDAAAALNRFDTALADQDGAAACAALSESARAELASSTGRSCETSVTKELEPGPRDPQVEVYGDQAIARADAAATFLTRYPEGWRVTAAGCTRGAHGLYDCTLKGS